jgi:hypothetical protein
MTENVDVLGKHVELDPSMVIRKQALISPHSSRPSMAATPRMHPQRATCKRYTGSVMEVVEVVKVMETTKVIDEHH